MRVNFLFNHLSYLFHNVSYYDSSPLQLLRDLLYHCLTTVQPLRPEAEFPLAQEGMHSENVFLSKHREEIVSYHDFLLMF